MRLALVYLCLALCALGACDDDSGEDKGGDVDAHGGESGVSGFETLSSMKARDTTPDAPEADMARLVEGQVAFSVDLYHALRARSDEDLIFSPFSVSQALAMTWAGARGETEAEIASTLHFDLPQAQLHPAYNALDLALRSRGEAEDTLKLEIANSVWGQVDWAFLEGFLDALAEHYGAAIYGLDFKADPEATRAIINDWVASKTYDKIRGLIAKGQITTKTKMVLVNAIYMSAAWLNAFDPDDTRDRDFHLLNGGTAEVEMMYQSEALPFYEGAGFKALEMPYIGEDLSMVAVLPEAGRFEEIEAGLTAAQIEEIRGQLRTQQVEVNFPKFKLDAKAQLAEALNGMGMRLAFTDAADFSGISADPLKISEVIHAATIEVSEARTEAAAATAVIMMDAGAAPPVEYATFNADRPFLFFVQDRTGAILFMGRVLNPAP